MKWTVENFGEVWLDLADTDKAINYQAFFGYSPSAAYQTTKANGDAWLNTNREAVALIPEDHVIRFAQWVQLKDYRPFRHAIAGCYKGNAPFRDAVTVEAEKYVTRQVTLPQPAHFAASGHYILREIAACCVRAKTLQAVCLYPGQQKEPFRIIRDGMFPDAPLGLERYAPVAVTRRRKVAAPQADFRIA